jgi:ferrochelatase
MSLPRSGVVLVNLGTPAAPTVAAVRRYLREFLSDSRVIEVPGPLWWLILNLFILPLRPKRVAKLYASIWQNGDSPMRHILREQSRLLEPALQAACAGRGEVRVLPAMTYGEPALASALDALMAAGVEQIVVLPLFPQFSATSTAPVYDAVQRWSALQRNLPGLTIINDYCDHPLFISALAASVREHWAAHGRADKLLLSFHGIPQPYADKGDPYAERCKRTALALAAALKLADGEWAWSFQSRFGLQEWVKPYTDALLKEWGAAGVASVQVACPAFSADCLETLEEIAEQNKEFFLHAGGKRYEYIPALNARADHIALLQALVQPHLDAFISR